MKIPTIQEMLDNEDFIYWAAREYLDGYYGSLCTSEEADNGYHYELLFNDIKTGCAENVWLAYQEKN